MIIFLSCLHFCFSPLYGISMDTRSPGRWIIITFTFPSPIIYANTKISFSIPRVVFHRFFGEFDCRRGLYRHDLGLWKIGHFIWCPVSCLCVDIRSNDCESPGIVPCAIFPGSFYLASAWASHIQKLVRGSPESSGNYIHRGVG